jgi:hypothetical protein
VLERSLAQSKKKREMVVKKERALKQRMLFSHHKLSYKLKKSKK